MRCGSGDTRVTRLDQTSAEGTCFRCDKLFHATPSQGCGSFRMDGSFGVSGTRFENLPETVKCWDCGHRNPLRDPGPEQAAAGALSAAARRSTSSLSLEEVLRTVNPVLRG
ncbi:hypothetical protein [Streptomyces odonnellii]|uniref:hypothetical protein n=1 Tax=Streptomyces odonnellii TaxID=1417980 RepID=UPI001E61B5B5|nr:hypothetical protein [Streptomyces odonnellii]